MDQITNVARYFRQQKWKANKRKRAVSVWHKWSRLVNFCVYCCFSKLQPHKNHNRWQKISGGKRIVKSYKTFAYFFIVICAQILRPIVSCFNFSLKTYFWAALSDFQCKSISLFNHTFFSFENQLKFACIKLSYTHVFCVV